jgi:hypothetical protein
VTVRSPAAAIGWQFRRRHRWGFAALAGYLAVLAVVKLAIVASGRPVTLESPARFAIAVPVPLAATFTYLLAVFSFGLSGDLAARPSVYPARMFTLPVTTRALVGWPMLYGTVVMAIVWLATRLLVLWPSGVAIPVVWPALLAAVLLVWTQALTWMPYGLPGVRVALAMLWLVAIDTVVLLALYFQASEAVMLAILAPLLPLAYPVARLAVARARRSEVPDWRGRFIRPAAIADPGHRKRRHSGPARAQAWFEWRRHGRSLPVLVAALLPFELALLWAADGAPALVWLILLGVALTPPFMATFAAATVRTAGAMPFLATRPLSSAALVAAKLKMAMWSTLAAWGVVLIAVPLALELSDTSSLIVDRARRVAETLGTPRAVTVAALGGAALLVSTFKQLVQSLYVGLSGRAWVVRTSLFLALSFLVIIGPLVLWIGDHVAVVWRAVPWILAVLAALKLSAAGWVATRLHSAGLVSDGTLVAGAAGWAVVVLALHAVLLWLVDTPFIPNYLLLLIAILATPLARIAAAPVALAWNRHR